MSLSRSGGGGDLNELFCLLSSHHLNSFVFQVSVRWENHTSPVFCLQLLSFNPSYQHTDGHELSPQREAGSSQVYAPPLLMRGRTLSPGGRRDKLKKVFAEIIGTCCESSEAL